ncbi:unnamed protein product, partial [Mycena citricolor]
NCSDANIRKPHHCSCWHRLAEQSYSFLSKVRVREERERDGQICARQTNPVTQIVNFRNMDSSVPIIIYVGILTTIVRSRRLSSSLGVQQKTSEYRSEHRVLRRSVASRGLLAFRLCLLHSSLF